MADDGSFEIDESWVVEGTDGDQTHIKAHIEGAFASDGTATGTLDANERYFNGQLGHFEAECSTGTIDWDADKPLTRGNDIVLPFEGIAMLEAVGPDLLAIVGEPSPHAGVAALVDGPAAEVGARFPLCLLRYGDPGASSIPGDVGLSYMLESGLLAVVDDRLWVVDHRSSERCTTDSWGTMTCDLSGSESNALVCIDVGVGHRTASVKTDKIVSLAASDAALWTLSESGEGVYTIDKRDPVSGEVIATASSTCGNVDVDPSGGLWHAESSFSTVDADTQLSVVRLDPETLESTDSFEVDASQAGDLTVTEDAVWMVEGATVNSLDPATGEVELSDDPTAWAADDDDLWVSHPRERVLRLIRDGQIARTIDVPPDMSEIAITDIGSVWIAGDNQIIQLDPATTAG